MLNPDGTINTTSGFAGTLDPTGYRMTTDASGQPRFVAVSKSGADPGISTSAAAADGDENWDDRFGLPGVNGIVNAIAASGSDLYVGGGFSVVSGTNTILYLAKWNGRSWSQLGTGVNSGVDAIALNGSDVYVGGAFTMAGGSSANRVAKWDGTNWSALGSGVGSTVTTIAVSGTDVYVGGTFTNAGAVSAIRIAKWNGSTWSALGTGINGTVSAVALSGTNVYAAGNFTTAGGVNARSVARWDGNSWSAVGTGVGGGINALALSGPNLYAAGGFTAAGGSNANHIAKWDGNNWTPLGSGLDNAPFALSVNGTNLYVGGSFATAGGVSANNIARWDGATWSALSNGVYGAVPLVLALAVSGGDLAVGGRFLGAGQVSNVNYIATWNGSTWSALGQGLGQLNVPPDVRAVARNGTNIYAAGYFQAAGGLSVGNVGKWDGNTWSALGAGVNGAVEAVAVNGGDVYVGGLFTAASGIGATNIAKWNGITWSALGMGINGLVRAIAVSGNDVYAGGNFSMAGGTNANFIARWDGTNWSALATGVFGEVDALAFSGAYLYAGGQFTQAGTNIANGIARWDGADWSALGSNGVNGLVVALAVNGSDLYVGGAFSMAGATNASCVALWDGSGWSPLGSGVSGGNFLVVYSLAYSGSGLYVGGEFTNAGGLGITNFAKWNGNTWSSLGSGVRNQSPNTPYDIYGLAAVGNDVYLGGTFDSAGGKPSTGFASWHEPGTVPLQADFNANPTIGVAPLPVSFTDTSTGSITDHLWDFGDGATSANVSPTHVYTNAGVFSVSLTVSGPDGSSTASQSITVTNALLATVTIIATDPSASEPGTDTGTFTVTRTGSAANALTVNYAVGGTASNGTDYVALPGSVVIPAGSSSTTITVTPLSDALVEPCETVVLKLSPSASYEVGSPSMATVNILDANGLPMVNIVATDPNASETGPKAGRFTVTRSGSTASSLTVNYAVSGTASNGVDDAFFPGSITIQAGSSSVVIDVLPVDDFLVEPSETVVLTLSSAATYRVGLPTHATVTIADNDSGALEVLDPNPALLDSAGKIVNNRDLLADANVRRTGVVADGVTELLLRMQTTTPVTFSTGDPANGTVKALGDTGAGTSSVTVNPVQDSSSRSWAFAIYTSPLDFTPANLVRRSFSIQATGSFPTATNTLSLERPPVVLVHGVWSNGEAWESLAAELENQGFNVARPLVDYGGCTNCQPAGSFDPWESQATNQFVIGTLVHATHFAIDTLRDRGIAGTQVDIVGHSMGGLVARARVAQKDVSIWSAYQRPSNFRKGDFHKIVSVGSPHRGTPLADWLLDHQCDCLSVLGLLPDRIGVHFAKHGHPLGPAIVGFRTNSVALQHLGATLVPSHAIVGIAPDNSDTEANLNLIPQKSCNTGTTIDGLLGGNGNHDTIVPLDSQHGGLTGDATTPMPGIAGVVHASIELYQNDTAETASPAVWARVVELLSASANSSSFGNFGSVAGQSTPSTITTCPTDACPRLCAASALAVMEAAATATVTLTPNPGTVVRPGDTVPIVFTVLGGSSVDGALFAVGSRSHVTNGPGPFSVSYSVPSNSIGRVDIFADTFGTGPENYSASTFILVQPNAALTSIEVSPQKTDFELKDEPQLLLVVGNYGDGMQRKINSPDVGTTYTILSGTTSVVNVSSDGLVTARGDGDDTILVINSGITNTVLVHVQIRNLPPVFDPVGDQFISVGRTLDLPISASDPDGNALAFAAPMLPSFATFTTNGNGTGILHLSPSPGTPVGTYNVTITALDDGLPSLGAAVSFGVTVGYPPGDLNADAHVTGSDSLLINQTLVGLRSNTDPTFAVNGFANGDINQDDLVTGGDSLLINQEAVNLRSYIVTKIVPNMRSNNVPTQVTIFGVGFPTNAVTGASIGPPVNLPLSNVVVIGSEQINAVVPAGGGIGTGTVNVTATPTNGVISFGRFINR